jgi:hypothetical protein
MNEAYGLNVTLFQNGTTLPLSLLTPDEQRSLKEYLLEWFTPVVPSTERFQIEDRIWSHDPDRLRWIVIYTKDTATHQVRAQIPPSWISKEIVLGANTYSLVGDKLPIRPFDTWMSLLEVRLRVYE